MQLKQIQISDTLNRAFQKQSLKRTDIELHKKELGNLFKFIDDNQDEEYLKNVISDFLKVVYYKDKFYINVNKKQDLVIKLGNSPEDNVGVIIEFKRTSNDREMISFERPNSKAFHQLILYYLRERIDNQNHSIKHLIATNIYEWFIFDEIWFEKNIFRNTKLINDYESFKLSGHDTKYFYEQIAAKHIDNIENDLICTYFNLKDYQQYLNLQGFQNHEGLELDDFKLINLYKILSPEHLLKLPFANDSNSLNKEFYDELLYILGLEEIKSGAKRTIERNQNNRNEGFLIENTIQLLDSRKKLKNIEHIEDYGETIDGQKYSVGLELCITWLNRILFLKLLEGQLVKYHKGNQNYTFLNTSKINDYDDLDELFFDVLAIPIHHRRTTVKEKFGDLPYLNSSLFDITHLEETTIRIADLKDRFEIPLFPTTVLKEKNEKRKTGFMNTLQYLFEFLNSYNFASDDTAEIQEENKTIISASVLGLIFEKLNGYKDGSFFTPGFITMYICRETIRRAVIQKFKESNFQGFQNLEAFSDLKDKLDYSNKEVREKANAIINSIKICDPAVGSGHFLVSALNELIAIKSELQILNYKDNTRVRGYEIIVENDELIVVNEESDELFSYHVSEKHTSIKELQKLQEALFNEKRIIIENCLFGVDINPKSVMICRLRLWIELLKNAYYTEESNYIELETLPNIDINIKVGNSLISRFDKKFNIFEKNMLLHHIKTYKYLVEEYKKMRVNEGKDKLKSEIEKVKKSLSDIAIPIDSDYAKIKFKEKELDNLMQLPNHYELKAKAANELTLLNNEYAIKLKSIYNNTFEWFLEFPEILDDNGEYLGFDVVIGNPPYLQLRELSEIRQHAYEQSMYYKIAQGGRINLFQLFIPLAFDITKQNGFNSLIYQNSFLAEDTTENVRKFILDNHKIISIDSFPERDNENLRVFKEAKMSVCITMSQKKFEDDYTFKLRTWKNNSMKECKSIEYSKSIIKKLFSKKWIIPMISEQEYQLFVKIFSTKKTFDLKIFSGELDMTASKSFFEKNTNYPLVVKGAQVQRYYLSDKISQGEIENLNVEKFFENNKKEGRFLSFKQERIVMQRITGVDSPIRLIMTLAPENIFCANSTNYIVDNSENLKYLLGVLNSKLINYFFKLTSTNTNITNSEIQRIPIPKNNKIYKKIVQYVTEILSIKQVDSKTDTKIIESNIDDLVFQLYNLTNEEIEVVNGMN